MGAHRQRRSQAEKRELVRRQSVSGLSVTEFCQREGLASSCFYRWRQELDEAPVAGSLTTTVAPAGFVALGPLRPSAGRLALRLDLGEGVVLEITRG